MATKKLFALDFEVYGKVQGILFLTQGYMYVALIVNYLFLIKGVFFRKYTQKQAQLLGLRGWCMNTNEGTVKGQLEGPQNELNEMFVFYYFYFICMYVFNYFILGNIGFKTKAVLTLALTRQFLQKRFL